MLPIGAMHVHQMACMHDSQMTIMYAWQVVTMRSLGTIYGPLTLCMNQSCSTPVLGALYYKSPSDTISCFLNPFCISLVIPVFQVG